MYKKYRKKPVVIEAIKWTGDNYNDIYDFADGQNVSLFNRCLFVMTLEGQMTCNTGDYIIKGIKGELYPCRRDIFEETYEEVPE